MLNVEMTVREAVELINNLPEGNTLRERVFSVLESQVGEGKRTLTLHSFPEERKIACIKTVRNGMQWGLKESKDWVDVVLGERVCTNPHAIRTDSYSWNRWDESEPCEPLEYKRVNGKPNTLTASTATVLQMASEMRAVGAVVTTA